MIASGAGREKLDADLRRIAEPKSLGSTLAVAGFLEVSLESLAHGKRAVRANAAQPSPTLGRGIPGGGAQPLERAPIRRFASEAPGNVSSISSAFLSAAIASLVLPSSS